MKDSDTIRFWSKTEPLGDCVVWVGALNPTGYGAFKMDGKTWLVHRLAYKFATDTELGDLIVCHTCNNRRCVKPDHLYACTYADNMQRMMKENRRDNHGKNFRPIKHGTEWGYKRGCRCDICKSNYSEIRRTKWIFNQT